MSIRSSFSRLILIALIGSMSSCFSSSKVLSKNEASVGQQLTDLNHARQQGIITEAEYTKLKKALIKAND